jgi:hypothetical protein
LKIENCELKIVRKGKKIFISILHFPFSIKIVAIFKIIFTFSAKQVDKSTMLSEFHAIRCKNQTEAPVSLPPPIGAPATAALPSPVTMPPARR